MNETIREQENRDSGITVKQKGPDRALAGYAVATVFCFLFGQIYEYFGFGVTSRFMHLAFLIPLLIGFLPRLVLVMKRTHREGLLAESGLLCWRLGILTLTIGSLFRGALDIYGTQSVFTFFYPVAGCICLAAGICLRKSKAVPMAEET